VRLNGTSFFSNANLSLRFFFCSRTVAIVRHGLMNTSPSLLCRENLKILLSIVHKLRVSAHVLLKIKPVVIDCLLQLRYLLLEALPHVRYALL
jgi:hypothetical protein